MEKLVARRVEEELEKRKDEIEVEVKRRVEEAKRLMERQMLEELEKQREAELEAQRRKEVIVNFSLTLEECNCLQHTTATLSFSGDHQCLQPSAYQHQQIDSQYDNSVPCSRVFSPHY